MSIINDTGEFQNVLLLHGSSDLYGASKIFLITALTLRDAGHEVHVVLSEQGPLGEVLQNEGISVSIIRLGIIRRKYFNINGIINRVSVLKTASQKLGEIIRKERISIVYSNTAAVWIGAWVSKKHQLRHIWHIHEIIVKPAWFAAFIGSLVNRYSEKVIAVSEAVRDHWSKYVAREKMELIYNGIDYRPFLKPTTTIKKELGIGEDKIVVGMIGRVNPWKGQGYFLEMATELIKKFPNLIFIMVGDAFPGDEYLYEEINSKIIENKLGNKIFYLGYRRDISEIFATLDVFILPSILPDPLPTVILEAMAAGKPVVATAHGGACEMVAVNETGYLIPWNNVSGAVEVIAPLIEEKRIRQKMGKNGRERVLNNFSLESYKNNIREVFSGGGMIKKSMSKNSKPMHVCIVGTRGYPYVYGGYETFVKEMSERLVQKGIKVTIYCHSPLFDRKPKKVNGINLVYMPCVETKSLSQLTNSFLSMIHACFSKVDVIFVVNSANGPLGLLSKISGKPTAINVDGLEWLRPKWKGIGAKYYLWASRLATKLYDQLITDSDEMQKIYLEKFNASSKMIAYGANPTKNSDGSLIDRWGLQKESYFLIVGRLIPDNNADLIIEGFVKSNSKRKLVIVGDVPYHDHYAQKMKKIADDRLVFTGYVRDQEELAALYHNCYAYFHGHEYGGTNPAMLKALGFGCAILALDTRFNQEMLQQGRYGWYFNKSIDSVIDIIKKAEKSPDQMDYLRMNSIDGLTQKYDWEHVTEEYLEVFQKLCKRDVKEKLVNINY